MQSETISSICAFIPRRGDRAKRHVEITRLEICVSTRRADRNRQLATFLPVCGRGVSDAWRLPASRPRPRRVLAQGARSLAWKEEGGHFVARGSAIHETRSSIDPAPRMGIDHQSRRYRFHLFAVLSL